MKSRMRILSLLLWVGQFGFSVLFPLCFFLLIASWLQRQFGLGMWVTVVLGLLGLMTSISTARSCVRSMQKDAQAAGGKEKPPVAFNDHD